MSKDEVWLLNEKYGGTECPEYERDRKRLAKGEPLGYVIGWQPFLSLKIYLDSKPLIPRPETEWWAEQFIKEIERARPNLFSERTESDGLSQSNFSAEKYAVPKTILAARSINILDLCAGSGAIGCAVLARIPQAQVYFGEIDQTHEATIMKNIRENNLDASRATIMTGNLFEPFGDMQFDFIASNPPYIPVDRQLPENVTDYEPALALYAGADGLDLIRRIATELPKHLTKSGQAWFECDSAHTATACELFKAQGFRAQIRTDQYHVPRIIVVQFPS